MTQAKRILHYLQVHPGTTTMELQLALRPFVSNPRARISDLRKMGYVIVPKTREDGETGFYLDGDLTLGLTA